MRIRIVSQPMDNRSITPPEMMDQWLGVELDGAILCTPVGDAADVSISPEDVEVFYGVEILSLKEQLMSQRPELLNCIDEKLSSSLSTGIKLLLFPLDSVETEE